MRKPGLAQRTRKSEFVRMIESLRLHKREIMEDRPMDAIGYDLVINAAVDLKRARRELHLVEASCEENARRRKFQEESVETSTLPQKLLKSPQATLAEARSSLTGCRQIQRIWRSLGSLLNLEEGWNHDEIQLARCLVGQGSDQIRCSREAVRMQKAMNEDLKRPEMAMRQDAALQFGRFSEELLSGLRELAPEESSLHSAILRMFVERELQFPVDLAQAIPHEASSSPAQASLNGQKRWASLRQFVARQITYYRRRCLAMMQKDELMKPRQRVLNFTAMEQKRIDAARKAVTTAFSCFQKSISAAKAMGLLSETKSTSSGSKRSQKSHAETSFRNTVQSISLMNMAAEFADVSDSGSMKMTSKKVAKSEISPPDTHKYRSGKCEVPIRPPVSSQHSAGCASDRKASVSVSKCRLKSNLPQDHWMSRSEGPLFRRSQVGQSATADLSQEIKFRPIMRGTRDFFDESDINIKQSADAMTKTGFSMPDLEIVNPESQADDKMQSQNLNSSDHSEQVDGEQVKIRQPYTDPAKDSTNPLVEDRKKSQTRDRRKRKPKDPDPQNAQDPLSPKE